MSLTELDIEIGEQNAKRWLREGKTAFLPEEIEMWNKIKGLGFIDSWRMQNPKEDQSIHGLIIALECLMIILKEV